MCVVTTSHLQSATRQYLYSTFNQRIDALTNLNNVRCYCRGNTTIKYWSNIGILLCQRIDALTNLNNVR